VTEGVDREMISFVTNNSCGDSNKLLWNKSLPPTPTTAPPASVAATAYGTTYDC
jgi:hypothetical protein